MKNFDISIFDDEAHQLLKQLQERGDDLAPAMRKIAGIMAGAVELNFEREGRPRWPALAAGTIKQREKMGKWPGKILQRSGRLAKSWTKSSDRNSAKVGSNWPTARIHETGGDAGRGHKAHIPARPVRTLTARDIGEIKLVLMSYLFKGQ
ncbi:MAG: phage virion morphogenesis protein [Nitrospirae bacterium]|nr:phage virion morphogenesis protein [Nitrospirota bacterium]